VGRNHLEETILKTNLEAAKEIARQLRLRNIGGLIVIDFIDQDQAAHRDLVYQTFVEALSRDRAKTTALPISPLGILEMTRQRLRDSLAQTITEPCGACGGRGRSLSSRILVSDILRQLRSEAREFPGCRLSLSAHPLVTEMLEKDGAGLLQRLAEEHQAKVTLTPQPQFARDHYEIIRELLGEKQ
jgi:ribonuclease G